MTGTGDGGDPAADHARLVEENSRLNEQIKLLVQTEQRFYRSQCAFDHQLHRVRALADFSAECIGIASPGTILELAERLLREIFDIDHVVAARVNPGDKARAPETRGATGAPSLAEAALIDGMRGLPDAMMLDPRDWVHRKLLRRCLEGAPEPGLRDPDQVEAIYLPLRNPDRELFGFLLAVKGRRSRHSNFLEALSAEHLPFLRLLTHHLERAIQGALLTSDLRARGREIAETNAQLRTSLQDLERTQQRLVEAQKMEAVGRLAGGIAHDFNNLLTVILGRATLLAQELDVESTVRSDLAQIIDAGERAARITRQLLAFGRGQVRTPELLDLNDLAVRTGELVDRLIGDDIALDVRLDPGLGPVRMDRTQFEQVLLNLVLNARDAMPDGGTITIETRNARAEDAPPSAESVDPAQFVALRISDTGRGMDAATCARVFEPYFTTKELSRGTGLGLASVYALVQQNEGYIGVSSEVGRGTTFTLLFPVASAHAPSGPGRGEEPEAGHVTVLLAEDEDSIRGFVAGALRRQGFRVLEARDGAEALRLARRPDGKPSVLVTDVVMPNMGGLQLVRVLRGEQPELPVLFISGYAADAPVTKLDRSTFLAKPFTIDELLGRMHGVLWESGRLGRATGA